MFKHILYDIDGVVIHNPGPRFSKKYSQEFNVPYEKILPFFQADFQLCLIGQTDLKQAIVKHLDEWNWSNSVDNLLKYWFEAESDLNQQVIKHIQSLRDQDIPCYLHTNNEKYRADYIWNDLKLEQHFEKIFSSAYMGCKKPHPKFWQAIHNQIGNPNKSIVLLWDDDQENIDAANNFGFTAKLYTSFSNYIEQTNRLLN